MAAQDRWGVRSLYLYLVCLVTLVMAIFAAVQMVRSGVELLYPAPGYYDVGPGDRLDAAEERRRREAARASERRQAILGLVGSGATLAIAGPVYVYHWRRVQQEAPVQQRPVAGDEPPGG